MCLGNVDLPEWFEDLTDDNVSAFKDVSTFLSTLFKLADFEYRSSMQHFGVLFLKFHQLFLSELQIIKRYQLLFIKEKNIFG